VITFRQMLQDGGSEFSKKLTVTTVTNSTNDPLGDCFFVVQKSSSAASTSFDNRELVSVASPEDMRSYSTAEIYPGLYRTNSCVFCFSNQDKLTAATAALADDIRKAVSAARIPLTVSATSSLTITGYTSYPLYSE